MFRRAKPDLRACLLMYTGMGGRLSVPNRDPTFEKVGHPSGRDIGRGDNMDASRNQSPERQRAGCLLRRGFSGATL